MRSTLMMIAALYSLPVLAADFPPPAPKAMAVPVDIAPLPLGGGLFVIKNNEGDIHYLSKNGRFIIKGELYDVLTAAEVTDFDDIKMIGQRLPPQTIHRDWENFNSFTVGTGDVDALVVIEPMQPDSIKIVKAAQSIADHYTVRFLVSTFVQKKSAVLSKILQCVPEDQRAEIFANADYSKIDTSVCPPNTDNIYKATMAASHTMGVDKTPFLVGKNGGLDRGVPSDLANWIEQHDDNLEE